MYMLLQVLTQAACRKRQTAMEKAVKNHKVNIKKKIKKFNNHLVLSVHMRSSTMLQHACVRVSLQEQQRSQTYVTCSASVHASASATPVLLTRTVRQRVMLSDPNVI
jgi:hypothetical protein